MTLSIEDLTDSFEVKLNRNKNLSSNQTIAKLPTRNLYKLILEGKVPFDESGYDFEIEHPD